MSELTDWNSFYVIVGSSAGALIGLQFVVIALIAETPDARADAQAGAAFSTPSVGAFRSRAVVVSDYQRSVAYDRRCRSCLGLNGHQWDCVRPHRGSAYAIANCLSTCIRGLVVSRSASTCGVCNSGRLGIRGAVPCAPSPGPRCRCDAATP